MNAEMRMYQALVNMPEQIVSRSAKVNHIADWADVTWAYADAWLRDWEKKQESPMREGYMSDDPMIDAKIKNDLGGQVPYNGGEGEPVFRAGQFGTDWIDAALIGRAINDPINPPHYQQGNVECIDAICDALGDEQFKGYLRGNAFKYLWRYELKGDPVENAKKAEWYIKRLIAEYELDEETRRDVNE